MTLTPDDLAAIYRQLLAVERGWRDMKGSLGLRPVFYYREDRGLDQNSVPAHVFRRNEAPAWARCLLLPCGCSNTR